MSKYKEKIYQHLETTDGIITSKECRRQGIPTVYLSRMENDGILLREAPGIYRTETGDYDVLLFYQLRYPRVIYSFYTAMDLLKITDFLSDKIDVTVNAKYKFNSVPKDLNIHYVKDEWLELGVVTATTVYGNEVRCYGYERILCDATRQRANITDEDYFKLIRAYPNYPYKDYKLLLTLAREFRVHDTLSELLGVAYG